MNKKQRIAIQDVITELEKAVAEEEAALGRNEPPHPAHLGANAAADALIGLLRKDSFRRERRARIKQLFEAPPAQTPIQPVGTGQEQPV